MSGLDPTKLLEQLLKVSSRVRRVVAEGGMPSQFDGETLAGGVLLLHDWLKAGGDLPEQWAPCFECGPELAVEGRCVRHGKLLAPRRPALVPGS